MEHLITILVNSRNRGSRTLERGEKGIPLDADAHPLTIEIQRSPEEDLERVENLWGFGSRLAFARCESDSRRN